MKIKNYEEIKRNHMIVKQFCELYHDELIVISGLLGDTMDVCPYDDYVKYMKEISMDMFIGNWLINIRENESMEKINKILKGDNDITVLFGDLEPFFIDKDLKTMYKEKLEEYRAQK